MLVNLTVDFNNQTLSWTYEIDEVRSDCVLTSKLASAQSMSPEDIPKVPFARRGATAKVSRCLASP